MVAATAAVRPALSTVAATSHRRRQLIAYLHALTFLLVYNPFVAAFPSKALSLVIAGLCLAVGWSPSKSRLRNVPVVYWGVVIFTVVAVARGNQVFDEFGVDVTRDNAIDAVFTSAAILFSWWVWLAVGRDLYLRTLRQVSTVAALWLLGQVRFDLDVLQTRQVGTFRWESYQQVGTLLAVALLLNAGEWRTSSRDLRSWWRVALMALVFYGLFQNRARGETIAVAIALLVAVTPRIAALAGGVALAFPIEMLRLASSSGAAGLERLEAGLVVGNLGLRDRLLTDGYNLLADPFTVTFGRGANWMQHTLGYRFGFHPHNRLLEAALVGGVLGVALFAAAYLVPVVRGILASVVDQGRVDVTSLTIATYWLIVISKSGTLTTGRGLAMFTPLFYSAYQRLGTGKAASGGGVEGQIGISK